MDMIQTRVDINYLKKTIRILDTINLKDLIDILPTGNLDDYIIEINNPIKVKLTTNTHNQD